MHYIHFMHENVSQRRRIAHWEWAWIIKWVKEMQAETNEMRFNHLRLLCVNGMQGVFTLLGISPSKS